jgi:hypothetical protein
VKDDTSVMMEFMKVVRPALEKKLSEDSLNLLVLDLIESSSKIHVPGINKWYYLAGQAIHPLTKEIKGFRTRIGGKFGDTDRDSIEPLVAEIHKSLITAFYGHRV